MAHATNTSIVAALCLGLPFCTALCSARAEDHFRCTQADEEYAAAEPGEFIQRAQPATKGA